MSDSRKVVRDVLLGVVALLVLAPWIHVTAWALLAIFVVALAHWRRLPRATGTFRERVRRFGV